MSSLQIDLLLSLDPIQYCSKVKTSAQSDGGHLVSRLVP
jgi:hypothetical protein